MPYRIGTKCNLSDKYEGLKLKDIAQEMKMANIKLSLISPRKDCKNLEDIVTQVNDQKTELNTVTETVMPSHLVKLAGIKLPVAPPPPPPQAAIPPPASNAMVTGTKKIEVCYV